MHSVVSAAELPRPVVKDWKAAVWCVWSHLPPTKEQEEKKKSAGLVEKN